MAPVFASADISALITIFPPPLPTKDKPSLVRSLSGNTLVNSHKVLARFRQLLESEQTRIKIKDLPARLGVKDESWVIESYDGALKFSYDKRSLVPEPEYNLILKELRSKICEAFIHLGRFAAERDLAVIDGDELAGDSLRRFRFLETSETDVVAAEGLVNRTKDEIRSMIASLECGKVNLSQKFPTIPKQILLMLVREACDSTDEVEGDVLDLGAEDVVFVSSTYEAKQQAEQERIYEAAVDELVRDLEANGFCAPSRDEAFAHDQLLNDASVRVNARSESSSTDLTTLNTNDGLQALVAKGTLEEAFEDFKSNSLSIVKSRRVIDAKVSLDDDVTTALMSRSQRPLLLSLLLRSQQRSALEALLSATVDEVEMKDQENFEKLFQTSVAAPLQLYVIGIQYAADTMLKQHLEEYLLEYFRAEIMPSFMAAAREQGLFTNNKAHPKDLERFVQSCTTANVLAELESAVSKFTKKQKIHRPSPEQLNQLKQTTLQQKARNMHKMTRGSDVLQNLIWILLAQKSDGLFISSGKDTSRMIKQYQLVGDGSTAMKLLEWRDKLKAGQAGEDDLREMRDMAGRVVEEMYGLEETLGGHTEGG